MKSNSLIGRTLEVIDSLDKRGKKIPLIIMSSPGYGKTTSVEMWCEVKDYNLTTLIASQYSQDDILGIQAVNNGKLERLSPAWFNSLVDKAKNGKRNVLFIDEITTCDEFIQAPLLNLIFARNLGLHKLPENTLIVTAGNYSEELNGAFSMTAPLVNRFLILNLTTDDFDISEVANLKIDSLNSKEKKRTFLGCDSDGTKKYNPEALSTYISKYLKFSKSEIINNSIEGLVGFTSIRSVDNAINFYRCWCETWPYPEWTRIVGDTLGTIERDKKKYRVRDSLQKGIKQFEVLSLASNEDEQERYENFNRALMNIVLKKGDIEGNIEYVKKCVEQGLSAKEFDLLGKVAFTNKEIAQLYDTYSKSLDITL